MHGLELYLGDRIHRLDDGLDLGRCQMIPKVLAKLTGWIEVLLPEGRVYFREKSKSRVLDLIS